MSKGIEDAVELSLIRNIQRNVEEGFKNLDGKNNQNLMDILLNIDILANVLNEKVTCLYKEIES